MSRWVGRSNLLLQKVEKWFYRVDLGHAGCQAIRMWNRAADGLSGPDFTAFEFDNLTSLSASAWFRLGIRLVLTRAGCLCALALSSSPLFLSP